MSRTLRVRLLGGLEIEGLESERFGSRKARTLLTLLALGRGRAVPLDVLVDRMWPSDLPGRPSEQIAVLVSRLRKVIGTDRISRSEAGYALNYDWLDVDNLDELASEAERRLEDGNHATAMKVATAGLKLNRGPLLGENSGDWAELERRDVERVKAKLRRVGADAALRVGAFTYATELASAELDADPYDETALRQLMAALALCGRPASALVAYEHTRERLRDDLGVDPSDETTVVHTAILRGEAPPGFEYGAATHANEPLGPGVADVEQLPGRSSELRSLVEALEETRSGRPQLVVVEGEAGIGKTRLLEVFCASARASGYTVLSGRSEELGRNLPLDVVFDALHEHVRNAGAEVLGPEEKVLGPFLGLGSVTESDAASTESYGDASTGQAHLFTALLGVLDRIARESPIVLALDDVHLTSASTGEWLHFFARRAQRMRVLIVAARRQGEGPSLPAATTISLGPLDLAAAALIVGSERAAALHARSAGNPLFLVELASAGATETLPASIRDAVIARWQRVGSASRTLQAGAVMGREIDIDLLASVLHLSAIDLIDHLEAGVRHGFLDDRGDLFAFRHELVRETLALDASPSRRALLHREAAATLASRPDVDPLDVAYHARLAGDTVRAASALVQAARLAAQRHDLAEAERLATDALALHDMADARLERARIRIARDRAAEAADDARAALGQGASAPALELAGWAAYYRRDFEAARRLADDGARLAEDDSVRTSCMLLAGRVRHADGELAGADALLTEALESARGPHQAVASAWLGALRVHQSRNDEALVLLDAATRPSGSLTHPFAILHGYMNVAYAHAQRGYPTEALSALDRLDAESDRLQRGHLAGRADNFRGWIMRNLGATDEADDLNRRGLEAAAAIGQVEPQSWSLLDLIDGRLREGALDEAERLLDRLADLQAGPKGGTQGGTQGGSAATTFWFRHALKARYCRARLALGSGEPEEARVLALEVIEDAGALGLLRHVLMAQLLEAEARHALDEEVDLQTVASLLEKLEGCAGLESWWLTADAAARFGVDAWWKAAERRVAKLAEAAGDHGDRLRAHAQARLEALMSGTAQR